jgi:cytidylate kinase
MRVCISHYSNQVVPAYKLKPAFGGLFSAIINKLVIYDFMNIIISGWPGAGTTSLALILCNLLGYKYAYGGGVFKYLAQKVAGDTSGPRFIEFEQKFGEAWDHMWEPYAVWKLEHTDHMLLEGKTTGFFVDSESYYEIMVIAKVAARAARAVSDGRSDPQQTIMARDVVVRQRWINLFGVDIYDPKQIADNYDLVLDNSNMTIADEVNFILNNLEEDYRFPKTDLEQEKRKAPEVLAALREKGKDQFREQLKQKSLIITVEEIFKEWQQHFPDQVAQLPSELKTIVTAV